MALSIFVLLVGQLAVCNFSSAGGHSLAKIREEIQVLEKENKILEAKIAKASSLIRISSQASRLNYFPAKVVYTSFDIPLAMGR